MAAPSAGSIELELGEILLPSLVIAAGFHLLLTKDKVFQNQDVHIGGPETAKRFGLSLWPLDQRFQPQASATASAQYLRQLHNRFGDWRLALAAYNAGEGNVQKLLTRYKTRSYDDIAVHLPAETQMYVPRVEAVIKQREGLNLEALALPQS